MKLSTRAATLAALSFATLWSASAQAAMGDPTGIWIDADKRGAVEVSPCASGVGMCGYVIYVFDEKNAKNCGLQILNEVTDGGGGWIYSPQRKNRYDVAIKRLNDDELRVIGNAGSRFFSRTMIWHRAPDNIVRCSDKTAAAAPAKSESKEAKTETKDEAKLVPTSASDAAADDKAPAPATKVAETTTTTTKSDAEATKPAASETSAEDEDTGKRKTCKYRIPYINRTISAPCRH